MLGLVALGGVVVVGCFEWLWLVCLGVVVVLICVVVWGWLVVWFGCCGLVVVGGGLFVFVVGSIVGGELVF